MQIKLHEPQIHDCLPLMDYDKPMHTDRGMVMYQPWMISFDLDYINGIIYTGLPTKDFKDIMLK